MRDRAASRARARSEARPRLVPSESRADARRARGALAPSRGPALGATPRARRHAALVRPPKPRHARGSRGRHPDGHRRQKRRRPRRAGPRQPALVTRDLRPGDVINIPPEAATASAARSFAVPAAELGEDDPERGAASAGNAEAMAPTSSSASPAYSSSTPNPDHVRDDAARAQPGRPPPIRAPAVKLPGDYFRELGGARHRAAASAKEAVEENTGIRVDDAIGDLENDAEKLGRLVNDVPRGFSSPEDERFSERKARKAARKAALAELGGKATEMGGSGVHGGGDGG